MSELWKAMRANYGIMDLNLNGMQVFSFFLYKKYNIYYLRDYFIIENNLQEDGGEYLCQMVKYKNKIYFLSAGGMYKFVTIHLLFKYFPLTCYFRKLVQKWGVWVY